MDRPTSMKSIIQQRKRGFGWKRISETPIFGKGLTVKLQGHG